MRRELACMFFDDIAVLSVDDMAKIKFGAPAVSRYHQIKKVFSIREPFDRLATFFPR